MLNILICNDEKPSLDRLANKIAAYLEDKEVPFQMAAFCSGERLLKYSEDRLFDIAFLGISMNAASGMDTAEYLGDRDRKICIVFVMGYMDYVLKGYKAGAFRCLVKGSLGISFEERMGAVLKKFHIDMDEICLELTDKKLYLRAGKVCLVESRGHKLLSLAVDGRHVIGTTNWKLTDIKDLLDGHEFLRAHQSYMVNMKYIVNITSYRLELEPDIILYVPRNRYPYVRREYVICKGDSLRLLMF